MLARAVSSTSGELFIHGGGLRAINVPDTPAAIPLSLGARFFANEDAIGESHSLSVIIHGPSSDSRFESPALAFDVQRPEGGPTEGIVNILVAVTVVVPISGPGRYRFELLLDGEPVEERGDGLTLSVATPDGGNPDVSKLDRR